MRSGSGPTAGGWRSPRLDDLSLATILAGLAAIQTAALLIQFVGGEIPCPLCLIERFAMFGIAFGLVLRLRPGASTRGIGIAMVFAVFLLVVSVRQVLLDIVPRPGHAYVGSPILGLHMAVWSVLIAVAILAALAIRTALFGGRSTSLAPGSRLAGAARWLGVFVTVLCLVNLAAVLLQCGVGACRTSGYALLS